MSLPPSPGRGGLRLRMRGSGDPSFLNPSSHPSHSPSHHHPSAHFFHHCPLPCLHYTHAIWLRLLPMGTLCTFCLGGTLDGVDPSLSPSSSPTQGMVRDQLNLHLCLCQAPKSFLLFPSQFTNGSLRPLRPHPSRQDSGFLSLSPHLFS